MIRPRAVLALLAALLLAGSALAQLRLTVNGAPVPGATTALVPGHTYAPAAELAAAMGAELTLDRTAGLASLALGGRVLTLEVASDPGAAQRSGALRLDGRPSGDLAAVADSFDVFVPVAEALRAFGGSVQYLGPDEGVVGLLPRARVTGARLDPPPGEALRVQLSAPVPVSSFTNRALDTVQVRLERSDLARARSFSGAGVIRADLIPAGDAVDLRLQLSPGATADIAQIPDGRGFELVVAVRAPSGDAAEPEAAASGFRIVLDPGHGGADAGLELSPYGTEASLTATFAEALARELRRRGAEVTLTRGADAGAGAGSGAGLDAGLDVAARSRAGIGSDLFVSLHAADLPPGSYALYYLGDAAVLPDLEYAVRRNAAAGLADATDAVRREVLLGLLDDLALGRRYAEALERELRLVGGWTGGGASAAPLAVLAGAAGRGLLLEFSPEDLASQRLPADVAAALLTVLSGGGLP